MTPKERAQGQDDSLFGLLSSYKTNISYIRILESEQNEVLLVQLVDNPRNWPQLKGDEWSQYRVLRRLELGVNRLSLKYISPEHLVKVLGSLLGVNLPSEKVEILNHLEDRGLFSMRTSFKNKAKVIQAVKKILNMNPQKKYEILEKCLAENHE